MLEFEIKGYSEEVQSRALKGQRTEHGWSVSETLCLYLWESIPK